MMNSELWNMAPGEYTDAVEALIDVEMSIENHFRKLDGYLNTTKSNL